jgi:ketosteroid isomerase-like protein
MSQENVEIVRRFLEAIGPDYGVDAVIDEFLDPQIEWRDVPGFPSEGVYFGRDAFRRHAVDFEEAWASWGIDIEDIRAAGDRVVARIRYYGVGKESGAPLTGGLDNPATGALFDVRAGRILRVEQFVTHAEALEAAGLPE